MKKLAFFLMGCFLFTACTTTTWRHPEGYGEEVLNRDMFACRVMARESAMVERTVVESRKVGDYVKKEKKKIYELDREQYEKLFHECMADKGWQEEKAFALSGGGGAEK